MTVLYLMTLIALVIAGLYFLLPVVEDLLFRGAASEGTDTDAGLPAPDDPTRQLELLYNLLRDDSGRRRARDESDGAGS